MKYSLVLETTLCLSIYRGDRSDLQCILAVHKSATGSHTPPSSPKTQPWAAAHNSTALLYAEKLGVCGFPVLSEHREEAIRGNETWLTAPGSGAQHECRW